MVRIDARPWQIAEQTESGVETYCRHVELLPGDGTDLSLLLPSLIETLIDPGDLFYPSLAFAVFEREELIVRPVKVIRDVRYLLIEPL
jgi:hypothetical protein